MNCYELVFILRQDIASVDVDKIVDSFSALITDQGGEVIKNEYWGLRNLAYVISNNTKGHYVLLGIKINHSIMQELERRIKLSEAVIRFLITRVDEISSEPSPILRNKHTDTENIVDVTIQPGNLV